MEPRANGRMSPRHMPSFITRGELSKLGYNPEVEALREIEFPFLKGITFAYTPKGDPSIMSFTDDS